MPWSCLPERDGRRSTELTHPLFQGQACGPSADSEHLFFRKVKRKKKGMMRLRLAFFEGPVKPLHRRIIIPAAFSIPTKRFLSTEEGMSSGARTFSIPASMRLLVWNSWISPLRAERRRRRISVVSPFREEMIFRISSRLKPASRKEQIADKRSRSESE